MISLRSKIKVIKHFLTKVYSLSDGWKAAPCGNSKPWCKTMALLFQINCVGDVHFLPQMFPSTSSRRLAVELAMPKLERSLVKKTNGLSYGWWYMCSYWWIMVISDLCREFRISMMLMKRNACICWIKSFSLFKCFMISWSFFPVFKCAYNYSQN